MVSSRYRHYAAGLLLVAGGNLAALEVGAPRLVSHTPSGAPTTGICYSPVLSDRGRFAAFTCQSSDVVPGEPGIGDLLRHDARSDQIVGVGLANDGSWGYCQDVEIGSCSSTGVAASESGAYVVLNSGAPLTPDAVPLIPLSGTPYVFLRNVVAATTELLTPNPSGYLDPTYVTARDSLITRSEVLFSTSINYTGGADTNGSNSDLYIKNWATDAIELISTSDGTTQGDGTSSIGVLSPDGRYVAFASTGNLSGSNPQHYFNLFLRDRIAHTTKRLTFPFGGGEFGASPNFAPSLRMTADNRHLLFSASGANFALGDDPIQQNIYLMDLSNDTVKLLPETGDGNAPNGTSYGRADISVDGRHLVFVSAATNLVSAAVPLPAVFVQDLQTGETVSISAPLGAISAPPGTTAPKVVISRDGTKAGFEWPTYDAMFPTLLNNEQVYTVDLASAPVAVGAVPATSITYLLVLALTLLFCAQLRARISFDN